MIRHTFACFLAVMFDSRCARGSGTARASGCGVEPQNVHAATRQVEDEKR